MCMRAHVCHWATEVRDWGACVGTTTFSALYPPCPYRAGEGSGKSSTVGQHIDGSQGRPICLNPPGGRPGPRIGHHTVAIAAAARRTTASSVPAGGLASASTSPGCRPAKSVKVSHAGPTQRGSSHGKKAARTFEMHDKKR